MKYKDDFKNLIPIYRDWLNTYDLIDTQENFNRFREILESANVQVIKIEEVTKKCK